MESGIVRICAVGIVCAAAGMIVRQGKGDLALLLRMAGGILIFGMVLAGMGDMTETLADLFVTEEIASYAETMLRALGIALLTRICADLCRDMGEGTVAGGVEFAGKIAILLLALPLIREIIGYAAQLWEME